jgi:alkylated DNA repair protein (DNA oxidative demethylase)
MAQELLFATREIPEGLVFHPDFLARDEERELLEFLNGLPFKEFTMRGVVAKRQVAQFGLKYALASRKLSRAAEVPSQLAALRERVAAVAEVEPGAFPQILINKYPPGAGIGWHLDSPPFGIVAGVSLGASCTMRFQRGEGAERRTARQELPARSLYLLTGAAREVWQHRVPPIAELRYSITLRTLRKAFVG